MTLEPPSIPELLRQRAAAAPDKPFLFSEADQRRFTYREFEVVVRRVAGVLWAESDSELVVIGRVVISFTLNSSMWLFVPIGR